MEKREERLQAAIEYLKSQGKVHLQKDVALIMGASESNVSGALRGVKEKLTDSFLTRFNTSFGDIFNMEWLIKGHGEMLAPNIHQKINGDNNTQVAGNNNQINSPATLDKAIDEIAAQRRIVEKSQEQIDRLLSIIENMNKCK